MTLITREAKGTASDDAAALTLTISGVQLDQRDALIVGVAFDIGQGPPQIKWGNRILKPQVTQSHGGIVTRFVYLRYLGGESRTRDVVATWTTTAPTAKAMFATGITSDSHFGAPDVNAKQGETDTTDPDSGTGVMVSDDDELLIAAFGSEGPLGDAVGTLQNGWTGGQRAGTVGPPPATNITIHEGFKIITTKESAQAAKTGATSRNWSTVMLTMRRSLENTTGVCSSDLDRVREIFEAGGMKTDDMAFFWNDTRNRWEVYGVDLATGTLRAHLTVPGWVVD